MGVRFTICLAILLVSSVPGLAAEHDVVIYGGTSAGVSAAIQAARMGKSAVLIEPTQHVGGLTTNGLGATDSGNKSVIGGIAREFYQRLKKHYDQPAAWRQEKPADYKPYRPNEDAIWTFEPSVAEQTLRTMLAEQKIDLVFGERLNRKPYAGVKKDGQRITAVFMESGRTFQGKIFIDATYEGDLLAAAGVSYTVGREASSKYDEPLNGVQRSLNSHNHRFTVAVDPYVRPGDPASGLLHGIDPAPYPPDGAGDHRVQAYCYRMCLTDAPANRLPIPKPADYDETKYELLLRNFEAGDTRFPMNILMMPNRKTDINNNCAVSTDYIGQSNAYPEASYEERAQILRKHDSYQKGLMWTLANHPRVPAKIRQETSRWGLPKDEFTDSGNWPGQIYVREARRMVSDYVMTEQDCRRQRVTPESVGMGSYNMDSHNCMRYVTPKGTVQNEGDVQVSPGGPYSISYRSIVPKRGECVNLLAPACVASSHIAFGSIRMEPVFFVLGQSAGTAAALAIDDKKNVQDLEYAKLRQRLLADRQVLEWAGTPQKGSVALKALSGIVVDDEKAERIGFESQSSALGPFVGAGYRHDGAADRGKQRARYVPEIAQAGEYEVRLSYSPGSNRATNVKVKVVHAEGMSVVKVNQKQPPKLDGTFVSLGTFRFSRGQAGSVEVTNEGADGHVIIDAVQWLRKETK